MIRNSIKAACHKIGCAACRSEYAVEAFGDLSILKETVHECEEYKKLKDDDETNTSNKT